MQTHCWVQLNKRERSVNKVDAEEVKLNISSVRINEMVAFVSGSLVVFKSRTGSNSQLDDPEPIATLRFSSSSSSVELCLKFEEILGKNLHDTYQINE